MVKSTAPQGPRRLQATISLKLAEILAPAHIRADQRKKNELLELEA